MSQCESRHRHQELLAFMGDIGTNVPAQFHVHLVIDDYATHNHPKVKAWLARRPRYQNHFTRTYASWLNQVERWFGIITQKAIRRGSVSSAKELAAKIKQFVEHSKASPRPFVWTATAESILAKIERLGLSISWTAH
jgi:transposase